MDLITQSDDERLTSDAILHGLVPGDLVTESLRAALGRLDDYGKRLSYKCPECEAWHLILSKSDQEVVLLQRAEAVESALCKAKEALEKIAKGRACMGSGCPFCEREDGEINAHPFTAEAIIAHEALSSIPSSPCRHEAEGG